VAAVFFVVSSLPGEAHAAITFPLEAKWTVTLPAPPAFVPAFDHDYLYVALQTNQLAALVISDGTDVWWVECPTTAPPVAGDGLVFTGSDGSIEARDRLDGRVRWRRPVAGRINSLHWDTGWLFATTEDGPFLAVRAADGQILWQRETGSPLSAPPAAAGDHLYVPLRDGRILALVLQTGDEIWTHQLTDSAAGILPVGDRLFVGGRDNQFHALDASDADTDWRWKTGADLLGLPVLDTRRVYFIALDNILRGHSRSSGTMLWKVVLPMRPFTGPLLIGDTLVVSGVAAELRAYSTIDGKATGSYVLKGAENEEVLLAAPPYLTSQNLFILTTKGGKLHGVGPSAKPAAAEAPGPAAPAPAPDQEAPAPADAAPAPDAKGAAGPAP
jgi:outer membrane protein assembly factor BamB